MSDPFVKEANVAIQFDPQPFVILSIDPGLTNLGTCKSTFTFPKHGNVGRLEIQVKDLKTSDLCCGDHSTPTCDMVRQFRNWCLDNLKPDELKAGAVVMEEQFQTIFPGANGSQLKLGRQLCIMQAVIHATLEAGYSPGVVSTISAKTVGQMLGTKKGSHAQNKQAVLAWAKEHCKTEKISHHVADAISLAYVWALRSMRESFGPKASVAIFLSE